MNKFSEWKNKEIKGHKGKVRCMSWSIDGKKLATGSYDTTARIWTMDNLESPKFLELKGHTDTIEQLAWRPTDYLAIATASNDQHVRIWDVNTGQCLHKINTEGENINISWSPKGDALAVGTKEDFVVMIDASEGKVMTKIQYPFEVNQVSWNYEQSLFLITTGLGTLCCSYPALELLHSIQAHTASCFCIELDHKKKYFATCGSDAMVTIWTWSEYACIKAFSHVDSPIRAISLNGEGEYIVAGTEDGLLEFSSIKSGEQLFKLQAGLSLNCVAWHPLSPIVAYAVEESNRSEGSVKLLGLF